MIVRGITRPVTGPVSEAASGLSATRELGSLAPMRPIANRTFNPNNFSSQPWGYPETSHILYESYDNEYIELWYPNWAGQPLGANGAMIEVGTGAAAVATGSLTYTDAVTGLPVTVPLVEAAGGSTTLNAPDGGDFKVRALIRARRGSRIVPDFRGNFPGANGVPFCQKTADLTNGDRFQFGSSVPALGVRPTQSFDTAWYGPRLIIGRSYRDGWAAWGDSRDASGIGGDLPSDAYGDIGQWPRLLAPYTAYVNASVPGDTVAEWASNPAGSARRREAMAFCNKLACGLGINDLYFNTRTAAQVEADTNTVIAQLGFSLANVAYKTLDPVANSGSTTPFNAAGEARRQTRNAAIRAKAIFFDPAGLGGLESVANPGTWASTTYQFDNTHETTLGNVKAVTDAGPAARALMGLTTPLYTTSAFTPTDLGANLLSWHKKDGATVSQWTDASANAQHFVQATAGNQPSLDAGGGLSFSSATRFMDCATMDAGSMVEGVVAACTVAENTTNKQILAAQGGTGNGRQFIYQSNAFVWLNQQGTASIAAKAYVAGKQIATLLVGPTRNLCGIGVNGGTLDVPATNTVTLTGSQATRVGGAGVLSIHEVVRFHSQNTSAADRQRVEGFVAWNNGTQTALDAAHPYKSAAPQKQVATP